MAHEDAGHYAAKHSPVTELNPRIAEAVKRNVENGRITCAAAHKIGKEMGVSPAEVGVTIDLLEVRISKCQMGLYGHHPRKRILEPAKEVTPQLEEALKGALVNNRISCLSCWKIAQNFGMSRKDVAAACETLQLKISPCQLGSF